MAKPKAPIFEQEPYIVPPGEYNPTPEEKAQWEEAREQEREQELKSTVQMVNKILSAVYDHELVQKMFVHKVTDRRESLIKVIVPAVINSRPRWDRNEIIDFSFDLLDEVIFNLDKAPAAAAAEPHQEAE